MKEQLFNKRFLDMALRSDFVSFIHKVVMTVNPSHQLQENWHIFAIAWYLEQVLRGHIKRLIICLPPRNLKSIISSVAFPAWALGLDPTRKIISITYGADLAAKFSNDFRLVITAPWFLRAFPGTVISGHKNTETEIDFTAGGFRLGTTITGSITGRGGHIIIFDDPIKAQDVFSDSRRETNNKIFQNTILSRLDDKRTGAIVVVMQRLHANDFVGSLLEGDGWTVLNLAAIAEIDEQIRISDTEYHFRKAGEPLHPEREPLSVLEQIRRDMGPDAFAAQYQQTPIPRGGLMILAEWIRYHLIDASAAGYKGQIFQSWDTAGKEGARNSCSVCTTWLKADGNYYLLDLVRGRFNYPTLKDTAINCANRYKPSVILIEDASTGTALAAELRSAVPHVVKLIPVRLNKADRMFEQQGKFSSGRVHFPKDAPFLSELLKELLSFPQSKTTDQVDSISQALAYEGSTYTLDYID